MLGVYIKYIDYDDLKGLCKCPSYQTDNKFPGLSAIIDGSQNNQSKVHRSCSHFGKT